MFHKNNVFSKINPANGILDDKFNQTLDWFVGSSFYTADVPLHFMFFNNVTSLRVQEIKLNPLKIGFNPDHYKKGDKLILFYANESYLNYQNETDALLCEIYKVKSIINYFNIPLKDVMLIASIYENNRNFTDIGLKIGLTQEQIILIDYYELQTFFFHKVFGIEHNMQYNSSADQDITFIFGKTNKPIRFITMYDLWMEGILKNSVTGWLADPDDSQNDMNQIVDSVSSYYKNMHNTDISNSLLIDMLTKYKGSPDNVRYLYLEKRDGEITNHCPSYPYDHSILFSNTKCSLIPETFYNSKMITFVTEKTYKAIYNHHPFTVLSSPNFLSKLKSRGYKTFHDICDESYDFCKIDRKRYKLVIQSTKELISTKKHGDIKHITEHNFLRVTNNSLETIDYLNHSISKVLS